MNDVQQLVIYNEITQEEFERIEDNAEKIMTWVYVDQKDIQEAMAFYVMKSSLLERNLI